MQALKTAYCNSKINWFVSFIDSSTPEERQGLADEIHEVYTRMESKGGKRLMKNLENRARCGAEKEPTSLADEVRQNEILN